MNFKRERKNAVKIDPIEHIKDMDIVYAQYKSDHELDDFDENASDKKISFKEQIEGLPQEEEKMQQVQAQPGSQPRSTLIERDNFLNQNFIDFYDNLDWKGGSVGIKTVLENGEVKKKNIWLPDLDENGIQKIEDGKKKFISWKECVYSDNLNSYYFLTGDQNNMIVLDLDEMNTPECKEMKKMADETCTMVVKTRKGFHYYYLYDECFKKTLRGFDNNGTHIFDLQSNGAIIYCPPSKYQDCQTGETHSYVLQKCSQLVPMPEDLKRTVLSFVKKDKTRVKEKVNIVKEKKEEEKKEEKWFDDLAKEILLLQDRRSPDKNYEPFDLETAKEIVMKCFSIKRATERESWMYVGMTLKNVYGEAAFDLWIEFSKKCKKFPGIKEVSPQWDSYHDMGKGKWNCGSLVMWAKEDNKKAYEKLMGKDLEDASEVEDSIAKYLIDEYKNFFWTEEEPGETRLYVWDKDQKKWVYDTKGKRSAAMGLLDRFLATTVKAHFKNSETAKKILSKMTSRKYIIEATSSIMGFRTNIKWERDPLLLGYDNGVLNILTGEFREKKPEDFIKMSVKRDYTLNKMPQDQKKKLVEQVWEFLKTILYKQEVREYMLKVYSTCLYGRYMPSFYILNGSGGNGKSSLNDLLMKALGDYAVLGHNSILLESSENKPNSFLVALEYKRAVIFREPKKTKPLVNTNIKNLTGSLKYVAKDLWQGAGETQRCNYGTYMCECNQKPLLEDESGDAEIRRFKDVLYPAKFVTRDDEVNKEEGIFKANPMFQYEEWQEEVADIFIEILMGYFQQIYPEKCIFEEPEEVEKRSIAYMADSSMILTWLNQHYTKQDPNIPAKEQNRISLKDLYDNMVITLPINPNEKRIKNQSWLKKELLCNFMISKHFFERRRFGSVEDNDEIFSTLIGWEKKEI